MRTAYLAIGLLLGMYLTSINGILVTEQIERRWEKDITAFTLTGYYEGWDRGREYTEARIRWQLDMCVREMNQRGKN